jgi:ribosome maturation factor RimP
LVTVRIGDDEVTGRIVAADEQSVTLEIAGDERSVAFEELGPGRVQLEFDRKGV